MTKTRFGFLLSIIIATCLSLASSTVCMAAEPDLTSYIEAEGGCPLPTSIDSNNDVMPCSNVIYGPITGTTTGYLSSSFTVPLANAGDLIKIAWIARPQDGASSSAIFKLTVTGNGYSHVVYLPVSESATGYSISTLPSGTYTYTITPYSGVSGTYIYGIQFYAY